MSQRYRIAQLEEMDALLERVRRAYEPEEARPAGRIDDRVERQRSSYCPDGPSHRVDLTRQLTCNLEVGPLDLRRFGQARDGRHRVIVKTEPRARDYDGSPPRSAPREPVDTQGAGPRRAASAGVTTRDRVETEAAFERAVDYNEKVLVPAARRQPTTGAVAELRRRAPAAASGAAAEASAPETTAGEKTSAGFVYADGGAFITDYAAGADVVSGEGATYRDAGRTCTHIATSPKDRTPT